MSPGRREKGKAKGGEVVPPPGVVDAKSLTTPRVAPGNGDVGEVVKAAQYSADLAGVVPDEELAPTTEVMGSRSQRLMRRAALAYCHNASLPIEERQPIKAIMEEAGIPMPLYWQMAESPEWDKVMRWATHNAIVVPRIPEMVAAATNFARAGDARSFKEVMALVEKHAEKTEDEYRKGLERLDEVEFQGVLGDLQKTIEAMLSDADVAVQAAEAAKEVQAEARRRLMNPETAHQKKLDEELAPLNHRALEFEEHDGGLGGGD